jgi:hypothetical protein
MRVKDRLCRLICSCSQPAGPSFSSWHCHPRGTRCSDGPRPEGAKGKNLYSRGTYAKRPYCTTTRTTRRLCPAALSLSHIHNALAAHAADLPCYSGTMQLTIRKHGSPSTGLSRTPSCLARQMCKAWRGTLHLQTQGAHPTSDSLLRPPPPGDRFRFRLSPSTFITFSVSY